MYVLTNLQTKEKLGHYPNATQAEKELKKRFFIPITRVVKTDGGTIYFYADSMFDTPNYGFELQWKSG